MFRRRLSFHLADCLSMPLETVERRMGRKSDQVLRRKLMIRVLRRLMKARKSDLESEVFRRRIRAFFNAGERGKRIALRVGSRIHVLKRKSRRNGHFSGMLRLSLDEARHLKRSGHIEDGWLRFNIVTPRGDNHAFDGRAHLIGREGVSVISDIDDTIKHSEVTRRRSLLSNTFLREFETVPGMSELYQQWARQGAAFHYVSSSPWQLYEALDELCRDEGLPPGTFHLRAIQLRDPTVLRLFVARRWGKRRTIGSILKAFPDRRFVLVGDSGEKDPEIYGSLARKFPDRVVSIFIRNLPARYLTPERCAKAFREIPPTKWKVFDDASEIEKILPSR